MLIISKFLYYLQVECAPSWYSQCLSGGGSTPTTTTRASTTTTRASTTTGSSTTTRSTSAPTGITTTLPASAVSKLRIFLHICFSIILQGYVALPTASIISGSFDGRMVKYDRAGSSECTLSSKLIYLLLTVHKPQVESVKNKRKLEKRMPSSFSSPARPSPMLSLARIKLRVCPQNGCYVTLNNSITVGIHCRGPCTVTNVWWEDVCEGI